MGKNTQFKPQEPSTNNLLSDLVVTPSNTQTSVSHTETRSQTCLLHADRAEPSPTLTVWQREVLKNVQDTRDPKEHRAIKFNNDDLRRIMAIYGHILGKGGLGTRADRLLAEQHQLKLISQTVLHGIKKQSQPTT